MAMKAFWESIPPSLDDTLSEWVYDRHRSMGLSHEEARATMDADVERMDRITEIHDAKYACAGCGAEWHPPYALFKWCATCKAVKYCCRECQTEHRPEHKPTCHHNDRTQRGVVVESETFVVDMDKQAKKGKTPAAADAAADAEAKGGRKLAPRMKCSPEIIYDEPGDTIPVCSPVGVDEGDDPEVCTFCYCSYFFG